MAGFSSVRALADAEIEGFSRYSTWRKVPSQVTANGFWFDLSMSPGTPTPQYYASTPLEAATLSHSQNGGIFHGKNVSPKRKVLKRFMSQSASASWVRTPMILMDYLLYYPFVDESLIDEEQVLTNSVTLPRYTDGDGVQVMAVVVAAHSVGTGTFFTINYTNSDGVSGRVSQSSQLTNQFVNGTILNTATATPGCHGPFITLQAGDTGVRSIEGVTMTGVADVGLFSLVLVKPLAHAQINVQSFPVEIDYFQHFSKLPIIEDDAYLNVICMNSTSVSSASVIGDATFVWG